MVEIICLQNVNLQLNISESTFKAIAVNLSEIWQNHADQNAEYCSDFAKHVVDPSRDIHKMQNAVSSTMQPLITTTISLMQAAVLISSERYFLLWLGVVVLALRYAIILENFNVANKIVYLQRK